MVGEENRVRDFGTRLPKLRDASSPWLCSSNRGWRWGRSGRYEALQQRLPLRSFQPEIAPRPNGGGCRLEGTRLWGRFPDSSGKYREYALNREVQSRIRALPGPPDRAHVLFPCAAEQGNDRQQ